jgi:hypothetical protein
MKNLTTGIGRRDRSRNVGSALGAVLMVGLALTAMTRRRRRGASGRATRDDQRAALAAYLRDHLSGSDAAIQVVDRLRRTHAGTDEGALFASLFDEFEVERRVVRAVLAHLGASPRSAKRLASQASGAILKWTAGGDRGELSLFRTLEALAIGVQGKRCLWRALQSVEPRIPLPADWGLAALEAMAVRQWEAIESRRQSLAPSTFAY